MSRLARGFVYTHTYAIENSGLTHTTLSAAFSWICNMFCGLVDVRALLSGGIVQTIMCTASMCVGCWVVGWGFSRGAFYVF